MTFMRNELWMSNHSKKNTFFVCFVSIFTLVVIFCNECIYHSCLTSIVIGRELEEIALMRTFMKTALSERLRFPAQFSDTLLSTVLFFLASE